MNAADQCDIIRRVRSLLVSYFIDLGRIRVGSVNYTVYLHGELQRLSGYHAGLSAPLVNELMIRIRHLPKVRGLKADLDDWEDVSGSWIPRRRAEVAPEAKRRGAPAGRTLEIEVVEDEDVEDESIDAPPLDIRGSRESP